MTQDFEHGTMTAFGITIEMKPKSFYKNPFQALSFILDNFEEPEDENIGDCFHSTQKPILKSKYDKADLDKVIAAQDYLTDSQRADLHAVFSKREKLFLGKLGHYPFKQMDLELIPGAVPIHAKPYPVPRNQLKVFRTELERLVQLGVLSRIGGTEWASPTFITPKKDGRIRWVSNFQELNKVICCKIYPRPLIQDILKKHPGYQYFTKIDISMHYYTFELMESAKDLCVIITPFGK
jgi:hypothetical protein